MTQMILAVAITLPAEDEEQHDKDKCPFCKEDAPADPQKAKIGKDNKSSELAGNLEDVGDKKFKHLYEDSGHGKYSAEAHHLICGNEILGDHKEVEKYLIAEDKTATRGGKGLVAKKYGDVPWNVNAARNGIWLPSVPDKYRVTDGREPEVWWGVQKQESGREYLPAKIKNKIAFIVMIKKKLQFHKGSHKNAAPPHASYVELGLEEMGNIMMFLQHYSKECPIKDGNKKRGTKPVYPPMGLATILNLLSDRLKRELIGHPVTWRFFISKYAMKCNEWVLKPNSKKSS